MAIADRQYMRDPFHAPRVTTILIWTLIGAFVIQSCLSFYGRFDAYPYLALSVEGIKHGWVWQIFTFQFLHAVPWPWHVLFNCLGLYCFGRPVEEVLGSKRFLLLYFLSGVAGGLFHVLTTVVLPKHDPLALVVGASAGVCGMVAIFCSLYPMQELRIWFYLLPIPIRARWLLIGLGFISLYGTLVPFDNVAHDAHLGGLLLGIVYVRWGNRLSEKMSGWNLRQKREPKLELRGDSTRRGGGRTWRRSSPERVAPPEEFMSKEVDPILDKISAQGIHALTEQERKILEAARKKIRR